VFGVRTRNQKPPSAMATRTEQWIELPSPSPGTQRQLKVIRYGAAGARPKIYLQTGLHADELPGMVVLHHLDTLLSALDEKDAITGEIILVPVANPIGLSQTSQGYLTGRLENSSGKNFNRHYPDLTEAVATRVLGHLTDDELTNVALIREALVSAVAELQTFDEADVLRNTLMALAVDTDACMDLHCDREALVHVFTGTALENRMRGLAARVGARGFLLAKESGGNPFDEAVGAPWWCLADRFPDRPIPPACLSGTIEYRGSADVDDELGAQDAQNLLDWLADEGAVDAQPAALPAPLSEPTPLEAVNYLRSPVCGVILYTASPGDQVKAEDVVAVVLDPLKPGDSGRTAVSAGTDGLVFARSAERFTRPGAIIMSIAGTETVNRPSGQVGLLTD
jgi:uncharacterized protein